MDIHDTGRPRAEQTFFEDPAVDRVMAWVFALSTEVWVLRDRLQRLEMALQAQGGSAAAALASYEPTAEERAALARDRDAFTATLMEALLGRQVSKGAP
jgi:hypothetical protein